MAKRLWNRIGGEPWMVNPLPPGFGDAMKRYRAAGLSPQEAMRRTWQDVKASRGAANPLGEELVVIGALNPRRKEVKPMAKVKSRHRARARVRHRRNLPARTNWGHRRRSVVRYRTRRSNPVHHRRRFRRNPVKVTGIVLKRPGTWLPYLLTAGASATVTAAAPKLLFGATVGTYEAYLTQAGIGVAGAILLPMVMNPIHGLVWFVVSGSIIVADTIGRYALGALGLGAYPRSYYPAQLAGVDLYPRGLPGNNQPPPGWAVAAEHVSAPRAPWLQAGVHY